MDKKKTLLHVLMSWAEDTEPDMLLLDMDLAHAPEASQWSLTDLSQQVRMPFGEGRTAWDLQSSGIGEGVDGGRGCTR